MALGAVKAIEDSGKKVGVDIFIGGFDWTPKGIKSIYNKKLSASIGGHFMMGALAIIAIYNEEQGISHNVFVNGQHNSFELSLINQHNISQYIKLLQTERLSQVSFKKLAKLYQNNEDITSLSILEILEKSHQN